MGVKVRKNNAWVALSGGGGSGGAGAVPSKTIVMYHGDVAPSGWVICDNSAAAIAAGAPDLRDKFIVATGSKHSRTSSGGSNNAVVVSHSHTINNHTHGFTTDPAGIHYHNFPGDDQLTFANGVAGWGNVSDGNFSYDANSTPYGGGKLWRTTNPKSASGNNHTHGGTTNNPNDRGTDSVGSLATDANLPPYYALTFIMKI